MGRNFDFIGVQTDDATDFLTLFAETTGAAQYDAAKLAGTAYAVPGGKTLRIVGAIVHCAGTSDGPYLLYGDNAIAAPSGTSPTTPKRLTGKLSDPSAGKGKAFALGTCDIPAGKYLHITGGAACSVTLFGYLF